MESDRERYSACVCSFGPASSAVRSLLQRCALVASAPCARCFTAVRLLLQRCALVASALCACRVRAAVSPQPLWHLGDRAPSIDSGSAPRARPSAPRSHMHHGALHEEPLDLRPRRSSGAVHHGGPHEESLDVRRRRSVRRFASEGGPSAAARARTPRVRQIDESAAHGVWMKIVFALCTMSFSCRSLVLVSVFPEVQLS